MFAFPIHHPQPSVHSTSTTTARTQYERELERLAFLTQQHEQQRRRAEAAARQAALAAYVEEQERRHREEAFERAVQQEVERRRLQQALEHRAALARRAQEERDAALYRQAVVEAAQRRAALVAREQHRRRVEAEQDHRRRIVEARRQQRARQSDFPHSLVQLFLDLVNSAAQNEPEQQAVAAPALVVADKAASSSSPAPSSAAHAEPSLPDPAVEALQKRFERDAARQAALDTLNGLSTEFDSRLSSFTSPSALTFQSPPSPTSTSSTPPLAFGKPNAGFLGHEDFLVSLLSKVDAVSSGGDKVIKQARKALVKRVEVELAKLDELKEHEWERQSQQAASEAGEGSERPHDDSTAAAAPAPSADTAVAEPESAKVESATASSPSSPTLDNSTPTPVDAPADQSTRLTAESLASLPTDAANPNPTVPRPRSRASTASLDSDTSSAVDRYVAEMLRRAKDLADRIDAEEEAEKAASAPAPASDESGSPAEATSVPPAAAEAVEAGALDEQAAVKAPSSRPAATEPLEDGVDEEIDVEGTLRRKRSSSATVEPRASGVSSREGESAVRKEAVEEHEAEDVASEAGTEEFLVV
ncbi:uncharacterized protein RHOBADRAFT_53509 [Rhodotorula graminis WP1]|uniref:BAG domain-containing protein n=1 Tax=Rhodotorula graminis (strain WP1) TaxID=578459 RepID=A0A194S4M9_RHOGW|nr:uncharacterized protein RHOBADRAFT_53509 [Rhodotorula graminis WP1]KPV75542.1 hypothetical protein RHOBADRAFT_53509 [Rhodotorula graminis WP1]